MLTNTNLESRRRWLEQRGNILRRDVGDDIAETVYLEDYAPQGLRIDRLGLGCVEAHEISDLLAKFCSLHALGKVSRYRRENIASVKSVTHRLSVVVLCVDVANLHAFFAPVDQGKHTIVGRHKVVSSRGQKDWAPCRTHARIYDHDMDRAVGKV